MKNVFVWAVAGAFLAFGAVDILRQKRKTAVLDEIVSFIRFVESELNFHSSDFYSLLENAKLQNYKYLHFENNSITADGLCDENIKRHFYRFTERIGTTDTQGQLSLCDEYLQKFTATFAEHKAKEKSRLQVNAALSVLTAVCILVLFI